jgi:hypothetical protein
MPDVGLGVLASALHLFVTAPKNREILPRTFFSVEDRVTLTLSSELSSIPFCTAPARAVISLQFSRAKLQVQPAASLHLGACTKIPPCSLASPSKNCPKDASAAAWSSRRSEKYFASPAESITDVMGIALKPAGYYRQISSTVNVTQQ